MKTMKTNKIIYIFALIISSLFISCEDEENVQFDPVNGKTLISFVGSANAIPVNDGGVSAIEISVEVTSSSTVDRVLNVSVDESSTATSDQYTISDFIIPAGEFIGKGTVSGNYDALPALGALDLVLKLTGVNGSESSIGDDTFTVTLERFCPFEISNFTGTYTANQGGSIYTVTATEGPEENTLVLSNIENRGDDIQIIIEFTPDVYSVKVRADLDDLIYVHPTFGNVDPSNTDPITNTFNQCSGAISLEYRACIPDGRCFGNRVIEFTKD